MLVCDVVWQPGNAELLPSVQAEVFEEIATMDCPFEGIPTVPPRKDMDHMVPAFLCVDFASSCYAVRRKRATACCKAQVFFCSGCRYRVTAHPNWPVHKVKQALYEGGISRSNKPEDVRNTPGIQRWEDLVSEATVSGGTSMHAPELADLNMWLAACRLSSTLGSTWQTTGS